MNDETDTRGELGPAGPPIARRATWREHAVRDMGGVLSSILPGAGHLVLRQFVRGGAWLVVALLVTFLWWGLRLPHTLGGLALALFATIAVWVFAGMDALFGFRRAMPRASAGWLLLTVPVAVVCAAVVSNLLLRASGFRVYSMPSNAMESTIVANEDVLTDTHAYGSAAPQQGQVIAFDHQGQLLFRRIVGVGPASVAGKNGLIAVNGAALAEPYARHNGPAMPNLDNFAPVDVTPDEFFVAGDNRDSALDSRTAVFGLVTRQAVAGKALYILRTANPVREGRAVR